MATFLLQTKNGTTPPKYEHTNIDSAITEAKRLHTVFQTDVRILKVVGEVKFVEVPVTRRETKVQLELGLGQTDDLPF